MGQTTVTFRMDEDLKKKFDSLCSELGLNMTSAMTIFAKTAVRENGIPFNLSLNIPNSETISAIEEANAMLVSGKNKRYSSFSDVLAEVENEI